MGIFDRKSNNPIMNEDRFMDRNNTISYNQVGVMTREGAINKTIILLAVMLAVGSYAFANPSMLFIIGGAIGGLVMVLVASFKPTTSNITAPLYAVFEGLFIGAITAKFAHMYSGIVFQAVSGTVCVLLLMLFIYKSGIIKVTDKLRTGIVVATGGVFLLYMLTWILSFFGISMPYLHDGGLLSIGISVVIIGIAAMNLLLDFDMIDKGDAYGAPKYMEWFSGMALLITLVWIYFELLRLLSYLRD